MNNKEYHRHQTNQVQYNVLSNFVLEGLKNSQCCVMILNKTSQMELEKILASDYEEFEASVQFGQFILLDADATLSYISTPEGHINSELFQQVIGSLVANASATCQPRVFCEIESMLRSQGNSNTANQIETLWNQLAVHRKFTRLASSDSIQPLSLESTNQKIQFHSQQHYA